MTHRSILLIFCLRCALAIRQLPSNRYWASPNAVIIAIRIPANIENAVTNIFNASTFPAVYGPPNQNVTPPASKPTNINITRPKAMPCFFNVSLPVCPKS